MTLTHIFKYNKVDLSRDTATPPTVSIDRTLLKRMYTDTREPPE